LLRVVALLVGLVTLLESLVVLLASHTAFQATATASRLALFSKAMSFSSAPNFRSLSFSTLPRRSRIHWRVSMSF